MTAAIMAPRDVPSIDLELSTAQLLRKPVMALAIVLVGGLLIFTKSQFPAGHVVHETIEWVGIVLIFICICGRVWCSLYIGGKKDSQLVTIGPYSVSRNPLYLFSMLGAAGAGAQFGNITSVCFAVLLTWLVAHLVVLQEERRLAAVYGDAFRDYCARVPRYGPRPSLWRSVVRNDSVSPRPPSHHAGLSVLTTRRTPLYSESDHWLSR